MQLPPYQFDLRRPKSDATNGGNKFATICCAARTAASRTARQFILHGTFIEAPQQVYATVYDAPGQVAPEGANQA